MKFGLTTLVLALVVALATPVGAGSPAPEDITAAEQWFVYDANRARWNPPAYVEETLAAAAIEWADDDDFEQNYASLENDLSITLSKINAQPPLAVNDDLMASAGFKAQQTADYPDNYNPKIGRTTYTHCSNATGTIVCPNVLVDERFGYFEYDLPDWWFQGDGPWYGNSVELVWGWSTNDPLHFPVPEAPDPAGRTFMRKWDTHSMLFWAARIEIGVGFTNVCTTSTGECAWQFVHLGVRNGSPQPRFITGVVFDDQNGNGIMDLGEGIPGVTVSVGSSSDTTNAGGGYAVEVSTGNRTVTASGGSFGSPSSATVKVGAYNVGVDFVKGEDPVVRAYEKCKGLDPTILGTAGDDVIYGTPGPDVIHGLDGNDRIYGLGGDDVICGGDGNDKLFGGSGDDRLYGGRGRDVLKGGPGEDLLRGDQGKDTLKGGPDADTLIGKGGPDRLYGGPGNDLLRGNGKGDMLQGDLGYDNGVGGGGFDECHVEDPVSCES